MSANFQGTNLENMAFDTLSPCYLQRFDFHLAKFHYAPVVCDTLVVFDAQSVLESDPPARKLGVFCTVDSYLPIERHGEC